LKSKPLQLMVKAR